MQHDLTLTETLLKQAELTEYLNMPNTWEVGRFVLDPAYRTGLDFLKQCLFLSLESLHQTANPQGFFASCTYGLSRLYRHFGCQVIA